jgi:hypothetical protein
MEKLARRVDKAEKIWVKLLIVIAHVLERISHLASTRLYGGRRKRRRSRSTENFAELRNKMKSRSTLLYFSLKERRHTTRFAIIRKAAWCPGTGLRVAGIHL